MFHLQCTPTSGFYPRSPKAANRSTPEDFNETKSEQKEEAEEEAEQERDDQATGKNIPVEEICNRLVGWLTDC